MPKFAGLNNDRQDMRKIFKFAVAMIVCAGVIGTGDLSAQGSLDLEMAKELAKQYGYSDTEINKLLQEQMQNSFVSSGTGTSSTGKVIDRNTAFKGSNYQSNLGYGLGQQNSLYSQYGQLGQLSQFGSSAGLLGSMSFGGGSGLTSQQSLNGMSYSSTGSSGMGSYMTSMFADSTIMLDTTLWVKNFISQLDSIYGHKMFKNPDLNFVPNYNIPTPANYKLAPGDELILDMWGATFMNYSYNVSPEGSITIENVGPVYVAGSTVQEAEKILRDRLSAIFSGLSGSNPDTFMRLSLGMIRSLSLNVVGDAERPGTFTLPSLATVFTAVYMAGGPTDLGSLRDVRVYRGGKLYKSIDFYDFLINGAYDGNMRIEDDDLIMITPYKSLVKVEGGVKRPMYYEMKEGETVADAIRYAAGYNSIGNDSKVYVERKKGDRRQSFDVTADQFASFVLMDGDRITVPTNIDRNINSVNLSGAVWHPGDYAITDKVSTLRSLIEFAGGLKDEAYMERGFIIRMDKDRDTTSLYFDLSKVMAGEQDIPLVAEDSVRIFAKNELKTGYFILTQGEFNYPAQLPYREGMTLGDAIMLSGGLNLGASRTNIDVARRNMIAKGHVKSDTVSLVYNFNLDENPDGINFKLQPYDIISVRMSPSYRPQQSVVVTGEVNFPGYYVVEKSTVRLSDIFKRAGGVTGDAYIKGAVLSRMLTEEEYQRALSARILAAAEAGVDTSALEMPRRNERYTISIDIEKALENPNSFYDVVLSNNDSISVPKYNSTVRISGAVLFPTVVTFDPSVSVRQYIKMAGGYSKGAIRSQKYIVFMNGSAATAGGKNYKPQPGCEIIVPQKDMRNRRPISATEIASIASSSTSLATMVVSLVNLLK